MRSISVRSGRWWYTSEDQRQSCFFSCIWRNKAERDVNMKRVLIWSFGELVGLNEKLQDTHIIAKIIRYINMVLFIQRLWSIFLVLLVVLQVGSCSLSHFCRSIHSGEGYWKTAAENVHSKETNFMGDYSKYRNRINVWLPILISGLREITSVPPGNTYPPQICRNKIQSCKSCFLSKATC